MDNSNFYNWFDANKNLYPPAIRKILEEKRNTLIRVELWKEYETRITPKLLALFTKQFPELKKIHPSFTPYIKQNIEHRIACIWDCMWDISEGNREGKKPEEVYPVIYPKIQAIKKQWYEPEPGKTAKETRENLKCFNRQTKFFNEFANVMQEDLLQILPDLINIDAPWWDVYAYFLRFECRDWQQRNERFLFIHEMGLTAEWLEKDPRELQEEALRIEYKRIREKHPLKKD